MKRRSKLILGLGSLVMATIFFGRSRIQYGVMSWYILHQDAPAEYAMRNMVGDSGDQTRALRRLWDSQKIVHREFVLDYLRGRLGSFVPVWAQIRPIALEGVCCGDIDAQQAALTCLEELRDPDFEPSALAMLRDVDPDIRRIAVMSLGRMSDQRLVPVLIAMLDDPDRTVRGFAAGGLVHLTHEDFGVRFDADEPSTQAAIARWKKWWAAQAPERYHQPVLPPSDPAFAALGPATDFRLRDLDGKLARLRDVRGKLVLLTFWATWCRPCYREIPELSKLYKDRANDVVIWAISADGLRDEQNLSHADSADLTAQVRRFARARNIPYRILIDADGKVTGAYSGGDLPTGIWIDPQGIVRRRFIGWRDAGVLGKMADAAAQAVR